MFECLKRKTKKTEQVRTTLGCAEASKKTPDISKAEEIAKKYKQMQECCSILAAVGVKEDRMFPMHSGGWRVMEYTIKNAGIDVEEVYDYIKNLAVKRKAELECALAKVDG